MFSVLRHLLGVRERAVGGRHSFSAATATRRWRRRRGAALAVPELLLTLVLFFDPAVVVAVLVGVERVEAVKKRARREVQFFSIAESS